MEKPVKMTYKLKVDKTKKLLSKYKQSGFLPTYHQPTAEKIRWPVQDRLADLEPLTENIQSRNIVNRTILEVII